MAALTGPALAAGPADVTVRVEGVAQTLVPRTAVRTDTTPINKDGNPAHTCSGTGAAGALEKATGGDWSGPWFPGFGYSVQRIRGEVHDFSGPDYFALWINYRSATEGVCGTTTELQQGDDVLFFVDRCVFDSTIGGCKNPPVLPLRLSAPRSVTPGVAFTVTVVEYAADGTPAPVQGAAVTLNGIVAATTNAAGNATVTVSAAGPFSLRATKPNRAPSASEAGCASTGADGQCGSAVPGAAPPAGGTGDSAATCVTNGRDGRCGSTDRQPPAVTITGIREQDRFARAKAPRRITATIADPSGLHVVKLRLTRRIGPRCTYYSARSERFRRVPCGVNRAPWSAIGDRQEVDYLLPKKLPRGRYVLDVNAVDKAYNRDDKRRRGGNRVVFHVR
ncbi:MAG TPA: hypothetical protein VGR11_12080 [Solirubrobacteraceae bacterium]|nr:hypothetical protein [Solirubrobacteraceae bacterium]